MLQLVSLLCKPVTTAAETRWRWQDTTGDGVDAGGRGAKEGWLHWLLPPHFLPYSNALATEFSSRLPAPLRLTIILTLTLLVAVLLLLVRPRRRVDFADVMVWQRWEHTELGAVGAHLLDRRPLGPRRAEEQPERWRLSRPLVRRARSDSALRSAAILPFLARAPRTPRLRTSRSC